MRAHRFGALHHYGSVDSQPEVLEFDFRDKITIFEGRNGTGKTSLLSAICWCMTGSGFRAQQHPTELHRPIALSVPEEQRADNGMEHPAFTTIPLAPIPSAATLAALNGKPLQVDTWVELTFANEDGTQTFVVKRHVLPHGEQQFRMRSSGHDAISVDPVAWQLGTIFPSVIPYIKIGQSSEFGDAVASLTGIQPLRNIAKHSLRAIEKLQGELSTDAQAKIRASRASYESDRQALDEIFAVYPELRPALSLQPSESQEAWRAVGEHLHHLEQLEAT